ncbi:MAG: ABC transporter permease [Tenericutes bacterium]|nr:ABC transporter permease [Mycoplasmatota bacterium]
MILSLIKRSLKLYFRDKMSVFFSMLGVFIIILLYLVFLGDLMASNVSFSPESGIDPEFFINSWIMAGVISVATVTTTLGAYGVAVTDKATKVINDFKVSPIKRSSLVLSYIISSFTIGVIMSVISLAFAEFYIIIAGGELVSFIGLLKTLGVILLSVFMSSSIVFFLIAFVKTNNAFGAISTVFGSMIGFLMGVYVPIGNLVGVDSLIKVFPFSHSSVLLRKILIAESVDDLSRIPAEYRQFLGIDFIYGDTVLPVYGHIIIMIGVTLVFFAMGVLVFSKKKESI